MGKTLIELITENQSAKAVSVVEKNLASRVRRAISEQRVTVARNTYGRLGEAFTPEEAPEFMAHDDNAYMVFFRHALQKFGVSGPQDFTDEATKQKFFSYLDANWKAQDSVQAQPGMGGTTGMPMQQGAGGGMENGTQTQLPAQSPLPQPPNLSQNGTAAPQGGINDPSVATMAPTGLGPNNELGQDTDDPELDAAEDDQEFGADDDDGLGNTNGGDNPTDDDEDQDEEGSPFAQNGDDDDSDDDFDDEDAYSVNHSDFLPTDDGDDDELDDSDEDSDDDDDSDQDDRGRDEDSDDDDYGDDEDQDDDQDDEEDPDLDVDDDDTERFKSKLRREEFQLRQDNIEDALFIKEGMDFFKQAKEALKAKGLPPEHRKAKMGQINSGQKKLNFIQKSLDQIRGLRDQMRKTLKKHRSVIKNDMEKSPEAKKMAMKKLAQMAQTSRKHFKTQAKELKGIHTGQQQEKRPEMA